jgi:hypothetical protein
MSGSPPLDAELAWNMWDGLDVSGSTMDKTNTENAEDSKGHREKIV